MRPHRRTRLSRQRHIGRKHLGIFDNPLVFGGKQRSQPALQTGRRGPRSFRNLSKRHVDPVEPALGHGLAQRRLAREMTVNAAVAHIERAGDIHHRGLRQPKAAQHVLGHLENTLRRQNHILVHRRTVILSCLPQDDPADRHRHCHLAGHLAACAACAARRRATRRLSQRWNWAVKHNISIVIAVFPCKSEGARSVSSGGPRDTHVRCRS